MKAHFVSVHSMSHVSLEKSPFEIRGMFMKAGISYCEHPQGGQDSCVPSIELEACF